MKFTEEDFFELSSGYDFSYENIARVANKKLKEWEAQLKTSESLLGMTAKSYVAGQLDEVVELDVLKSEKPQD